jgi:MtN3 and saliva related transmembrane protein
MTSTLATAIGTAAAICTTGAYVPQAIAVIRSANTSGLSLGMYMLVCTGTLLWLTYGIMIGSWPVIVSNAVTICLAGSILLITWRHRAQ